MISLECTSRQCCSRYGSMPGNGLFMVCSSHVMAASILSENGLHRRDNFLHARHRSDAHIIARQAFADRRNQSQGLRVGVDPVQQSSEVYPNPLPPEGGGKGGGRLGAEV